MIGVKLPPLAEEDRGTVTMTDEVAFADVFMSTGARV